MAAQEPKVKSPVKPGPARCDYCGCEVPERYVDGTFPNTAFLDTGAYACDACLLRESKGGVKDRFEAAALERRGISVQRMEAEFTRARGAIEISAAQVARSHLDRARSLYAEGEVVAAMEAAQAAWHASEVLHVGIELGPLARRDAKRQAGTRKPRASRRPKLDAFLDDELSQNPQATDDELWWALSGLEFSDLYIDGDRAFESPSDNGITKAGFAKRATAARKRRK